MSKIQEIENKNIVIKHVEMNTDIPLDDGLKEKLEDPLPNISFIWAIIGRPRSGKSTVMIELVQTGLIKVDGVKKRSGYKKLFKNIILCGPSLKSLRKNKDFKKLKYQFETFDIRTLNAIEEIALADWDEDKEQTLVIFDDVSSHFKDNKMLIDKFSHMAKNHRHSGLSMFILAQKFMDIPHGVRTCFNYISIFNCSNYKERDTIFEELPVEKKDIKDVYDHIFNNADDEQTKSRYNFLTIDSSLQKSGKVRMFKKFSELIL